MIDIDELIKMDIEHFLIPIIYDIGPPPIVFGELLKHEDYYTCDTRLMIVRSRDNKWVITDGYKMYLDKCGNWVYKSISSERSDECILMTKFNSLDDALDFYKVWRIKILTWAKGMITMHGEAVILDPLPLDIF